MYMLPVVIHCMVLCIYNMYMFTHSAVVCSHLFLVRNMHYVSVYQEIVHLMLNYILPKMYIQHFLVLQVTSILDNGKNLKQIVQKNT